MIQLWTAVRHTSISLSFSLIISCYLPSFEAKFVESVLYVTRSID